MNDFVINAVQQKNLTFSFLRQFAGRDYNAQANLERGRAIIGCSNLLNQYLYSYGLMVERQWLYVIPKILDMLNDNNKGVFDIYDYGCGQGLASLLMVEKTTGLSAVLSRIMLIEPSEIALSRAQSLLKCKLPHIEVEALNKKLDEVDNCDFNQIHGNMNIHIFSNILDIDGFNQFDLFNKILRMHRTHYIVAVSNDRDCYGGTPRLKSLFDAITRLQSENNEKVLVSHAKFERFTDEKGMKHVYFCLKIELSSNE